MNIKSWLSMRKRCASAWKKRIKEVPVVTIWIVTKHENISRTLHCAHLLWISLMIFLIYIRADPRVSPALIPINRNLASILRMKRGMTNSFGPCAWREKTSISQSKLSKANITNSSPSPHLPPQSTKKNKNPLFLVVLIHWNVCLDYEQRISPSLFLACWFYCSVKRKNKKTKRAKMAARLAVGFRVAVFSFAVFVFHFMLDGQ